MKRMYIIFIVICLPLFAQAGLLDRIQRLGVNFPKSPSRDFRLTHHISNEYEEGAWIPSIKTIVNYSDSGPSRVESIVMHSWEENGWGDPMSHSYYEYNAAGLVTSFIMDLNFGTQTIPFARFESVYDAQNRVVRQDMYIIDFMDFETWNHDMWYEYVYGPNNTFEVFSWENEDGGDQYFHSTFTYDGSGRITGELSYISMDNVNWTFDTKNETSYHPQDNSTGADFIEYLANAYSSTFLLMEWNIPILINSSTSYFWNGEIWIPDYRTVWEYDGSLRRIRQDEDEWLTNQWVTQDKTFFNYDANGNMEYTIMQYGIAGTWENDTKIEYFWGSFTSSEDLVQGVSPALQIKAWPMPFTESLNISTSAKSVGTPQISIYNSRGQLVREFTDSDKVIWDGKDSQGRDSANGIYFIRAKQDKASAVSKVIRVK